jgi:hypothetical protein
MAEIINLRRARKVRDRAASDAQAAASRAKHGRTIAEKTADAEEAARRERLLEGAKRED